MDERERDPVDVVDGQNRIEVGAVLVGEDAGRKNGVRQAHTFAVGDLRARDDGRHDALAVTLLGLEMQLAVIDQQAVARLHRFQDFRMGQVDAVRVAGGIVVVERKRLAGLELDGGVGELADTELRALKVGENADRATAGGLDIADALNQRTHQVMAGMAHVDAEKIGPGFVQLPDHRLVGRGGTKRGEDLYFAVALHQFWLSWVPDVSDSWTIQLPCLPVSYSLNPIC